MTFLRSQSEAQKISKENVFSLKALDAGDIHGHCKIQQNDGEFMKKRRNSLSIFAKTH